MFNTVIRKWNLPRRWIDEENMEHTHNVILSNPKNMKSLITLTRNGKKRDTTWDHYIKQSKSDSERQVCYLLYEDSGYICMYIYIVIVMKTQMEP